MLPIARGQLMLLVSTARSDIRMALRYTHATDAAKRRAVERLVDYGSSSGASVTKEKRQDMHPAVNR